MNVDGVLNPFQEGWGWWALGIALGVPVALVVLSEILHELVRRGHPAQKPVRLLRNWVMPVVAAFVLVVFALQGPEDQVWIRIVGTVLGFLAILLVLSTFNVVLFQSRTSEEGSWRERVPRIFIELARVVLVVVGIALLLQFVWNADVGGVFTALGFGSLVLGLALQPALGGVFSGLLLLFEQPIKIGDFIDAAGVSGWVEDINWRSVHIRTKIGLLEIVPNSALAGANITNKTQITSDFAARFTVAFATSDPPDTVVSLIVRTARSLEMLAPGTDPHAAFMTTETHGISRFAIYNVGIPITSPADEYNAQVALLTRLWHGARREGLAFEGDRTDPLVETGARASAMDTVASTLQLDDEQRQLVEEAAQLVHYGVGEVLQWSGEEVTAVSIVVGGRVELFAEHDDARIPVATVDPGGYIGQSAMTRETATTGAVADVVTMIVRIPVETVDSLVLSRPEIASEFGITIDTRRTQVREALENAGLPAR